jgi:hypothetical protein
MLNNGAPGERSDREEGSNNGMSGEKARCR